MAIYQGEETVNVTTPDGRTLTLPRSIVPASMMPQQIGAAPPGTTDEIAPAPIVPQDMGVLSGTPPVPSVVDALAAPAPEPDDTLAPSRPDYTVSQDQAVAGMTQRAAKASAEDKARAKQERAQAARAASPQGRQDAAAAEQNAAIGAEAQAVYSAADLQAAEDEALANAKADRNKRLDELYIKRAEEAQANADAEEKKMGEIVGLRKKIAGTKIDRSLDHPVLAAAMAAIAGLGAAMNGQKVDSADILFKVIERKVAAQEADLDRMGKVYGMTKEELDSLKEKSKSRLEFHNVLIAAEADKAIRHIEELTARSASEKTKANAKIVVAQLQQRAADKSMEAMRWGLDYDQKAQAEKNANWRHSSALKQADRHHADQVQLRREEMALDFQKALAADRARGDAAMFKARLEAAKDVNEKGMKGVDNDYLFTPEGRAKLEEAKRLEAEASALETQNAGDPMAQSIRGPKVEALRQKAAVLRGDARTFNVVQARNAEQAGKMSDKYAAAQTMMDTVDEIKMLYDQAGRGYISKSKLQEELQAKVGLLSVAAKDAWQLGAWDKGSAALVSGIIGQDPTTEWNVGVIGALWNKQMIKDPDGFKQRLDAVTQKLDQDVRQQMIKNSNWDGKGDLFTRKQKGDLETPTDKASSALTQARSGVELEKNADKVGVVGKTARAVGYPFSPSHEEEADQAQSVRYLGLSKDQEAPFEQLVRASKSADPRVRQQAIDEMAATAINEATRRPDFAVPYMNNLREHAPEAYAKARTAMPKGAVDDRLTYEDNISVGTATTPTNMLRTVVLSSMKADGTVGDVAGHQELARRAQQGDPIAKQALADVVRVSGRNKAQAALPSGSVFKEGR